MMVKPIKGNGKVYCEDCPYFRIAKKWNFIYYEKVEKCNHPDNWEGNHRTPKAEKLEPYIKNKNNDCSDFDYV